MDRIKLFFPAILVSLISIFPSIAQNLKYKDIYPYISSGRLTEAEPLLTDYLKSDPDNASANLQLALIYENRFKTYDPIGQYKELIRNAEEAKTYFLKAGLLIDEKEIRRNGDKYYTNLARPDEKGRPEVTYQHVKSVIDSAFIEIDHYLRSVPDVYSSYINTVKYYRNAYDSYLMLNGNYRDISDLYFQYNNATDKKLLQIKRDYDSCQFFLKKFLQATEIFPLHRYKQTLQVGNIENFKLDGLEPSPDFMDSIISISDYGAWAAKTRKNYNSEFKPVIDGLLTAEESLNSKLEMLSDPQKALQSSATPIDPDWGLIHKISGYDAASLAAGIMIYQVSKLHILHEKLFEQKLSRDTSVQLSKEVLLIYYSKLFSSCQKADSALEELKKRNNDENRQKYSIFISKYFPDDNDLNKYVTAENDFVKTNLNTYADKIKDGILAINDRKADSASFVMYKKIKIPLYYSIPDSVDIKPELMYTSDVIRSVSNEAYVAGFTLPRKSKGSTTAFLARLDSANNVQWLNYYSSGGEDTAIVRNRIGAPMIIPHGITFILNSYSYKSDTAINILKMINNSGNPDTSLVLSQHGFPRMMKFDEKSNSYFLTFKGRKPAVDINEPSQLTWTTASIARGETGQHQFGFSGNLKNIIPLETGWLMACNFTKISDPSFQNTTAGDNPGDTKVFVLTIDDNGNIKKLKVFNNPDPYHLFAAYKINDNNLNLIGVPGPVPDRSGAVSSHDSSWIHYIFDSDLKVQYYNGDQ